MRKLFASMNQNDLVYIVCVFKNHLFRLYTNGHIEKADEADEEAARCLGHIN